MRTLHNQTGSSHLVVFLGLAVIVAVGLVGYRVSHSSTPSTTSSTATAPHATPPKTITTKSDLQKASTALDNTAIDTQVNPNQLDSDLNALL